ncbi:hypothetical protein [Streptomyces sp. NRRL WC-3742]|nr:hypothetical protein [Streptomyces sp. NRRL WC-3742]
MLLVDRVGRWPLLICGFSGLVLALLALAPQPNPGLAMLTALLTSRM